MELGPRSRDYLGRAGKSYAPERGRRRKDRPGDRREYQPRRCAANEALIRRRCPPEFQLYPARFFQAAFSLTRATRFFDNVTNATTARTSLGDLEKSAGADYLPSSAANGTINAA